LADVSDVLTASIFRTMINFYKTTLRSIREDSHLHSRRRENMKYQLIFNLFKIAKKLTEEIVKVSYIIIIIGTAARIGPWPPLTGFRDG
jgi:hypothetical protein